jgi:hypothetical protein
VFGNSRQFSDCAPRLMADVISRLAESTSFLNVEETRSLAKIDLLRAPLAEVTQDQRRLRRRRLDPDEIVIPLLARATKTLKNWWAAQASDGPRALRSSLAAASSAPSGPPPVYAEQKASADAIIVVLQALGLKGGKLRDSEDWRILTTAADQWSEHGEINVSAIGRSVGLKHPAITNRLTGRCWRIVGELQQAFPALFVDQRGKGIMRPITSALK